MSREIKFRVWDIKDKHFLEGCPLEQEGHCCMGESSLNDDYFKNDQFIVSQYTGIKDKNGKDIYEGDIVGTHIGTFDGFKKSVVCYKPEHGFYYPLCLTHPETEVLGNIYENPELLNP